MASVDRLVRDMATQRAGDQVPAAPLPFRWDDDPAKVRALLKESRSRPIDWQAQRTTPGWTELELRQMDQDCEQLGEDHAYQLWLERRPTRAPQAGPSPPNFLFLR